MDSCHWRASTKLKIETLTDTSCLARSICHLANTHLHLHQPGTQSSVHQVTRLRCLQILYHRVVHCNCPRLSEISRGVHGLMALLGLGIEKEKMRLPKELWRVGEQENGWCHPDTAVSIGTPLILFDRYCQFAGALGVFFQKSFPKHPLYLTIIETHLAVEYLTFLYLSVVVFNILGIRQTSVLFLRNIKVLYPGFPSKPQ